MTTWQNDPETVREEGINVLLEQLLRGQGLTAKSERRSRRGAPDVVVELRSGDSVVLECKWEHSVSPLESQLDERLKTFPEALGLVGVLYPDSLRHQEDTLAGLEAVTDLQWWLHGSRGEVISERRLRTGSVEGRLALVLPATVCTGPSWTETRDLIERDFTLNMVIASHDPLRWNFSDSTDLSEALLVATRRPQNGDDSVERRTTFVNLWHNPDGVLDAHRVAQAIASTTPARIEDAGAALLEVDGLHVGEVVSIPESRIRGRKWSGVQFARADLIRSAHRLLAGGEVWVPGEGDAVSVALCRLGDIGSAGPDRRRLVDGFDRTSSQTAYPLVEGHDTEQRKSLVCWPDVYLSPLASPRGGQRPGYGDHLWKQASRLLVAERLWLNTTRVVAMRCESRVLSNVWWPVRVEDEEVEKALTLWMNSSLGLLTMLAERTSTRGGWVGMKKADLEELPVLDTRQLKTSQLQALSELFDGLVETEFDRLPGMGSCQGRIALDNGLSRILGLPDLATLRTLLASEPVVSNRRL